MRPARTLLLLRHAKSSWDDTGLDDHERPLSGRGRRGADRIGQLLARSAPPELVLCSSARRARETLERVADRWPARPPTLVERELYLASADALLARCRALDDAVTRVLLVGHNPGLGELAAALAGRGDAEALAALRRKFPTAALAEIELPAKHWSEIEPGEGWLHGYATPNRLARGDEEGVDGGLV